MNAQRTYRARRMRRLGISGCAATVAALAVVAGTAARTQAAPQNVAEPSISGAPLVGRTLTADRGQWTGGALTFQYAWLRCNASGDSCTPISGATSTTYAVTSGDLGSTLRVKVTGKNADGETDATSNQTSAVVTPGGQPANSAPPTISGNATVGETLTAAAGSWVGDQPITFAYAWLQCDAAGNACTTIAGETQSTYKVGRAVVGKTIRVKVTGTNSRGSADAFSQHTSAAQEAGGGGGGGGGIVSLPNGGKSVDAADVPNGERLIVSKVVFNPNPVTSRSAPIMATTTVKDTRGYYVRNAIVFIRSTPIVTSGGDGQKTATDGTITYSLSPKSSFPLKNGYNVQFFVKAYRSGDPTLAGISGTRLVQVKTSAG
jgi:hypothetical protein